eukprot:158125-Hanusia_phi.AAC.1
MELGRGKDMGVEQEIMEGKEGETKAGEGRRRRQGRVSGSAEVQVDVSLGSSKEMTSTSAAPDWETVRGLCSRDEDEEKKFLHFHTCADMYR